jgi:EmrB/QacA subfamily drug resistance transporter
LIKDKRMYTVFALMLASFLTAVDATIVDTAMPRIVGALGGFSLFTWLVTAYMLTSTATVPVYGKLADLIGRKKTFIFGAVVFVGGSALCGFAQSMGQLIFFRAIQGLGAGAVLPVVQTIIGDLFTPVERAKMQGWFSGVWGFSALVGPLVGGLLVDHATWRWLFFINLPFGILAILMIWRYLDEHHERRAAQVDYLGSITMTIGITLLLLALLTGGNQYPWGSPQVIGLFVGAAVLLAVFFWQEGRAPDPMLPLTIFKDPTIGLSVLASFMLGGVMYGTTVYLPLWAQGVQGFKATDSGLSLLWLSVGWPLASLVAGKLLVKMGVRPAAIVGLLLNTIAALALVILGRTMHQLPAVVLGLITFTIGCGMGFSTLAFVLGVQSSVDYKQRGVATASLQFLRTLGGLIWVSVMGMVMNLSLLSSLRRIPGVVADSAAAAGDAANQLLDPNAWGAMPPAQLNAMRDALAAALRNVHVIVLVAAVLSLAVTLLLPNLRLSTKSDGKPDLKAASTGH